MQFLLCDFDFGVFIMKHIVSLLICLLVFYSCKTNRYGFPEYLASELSNNDSDSYRFVLFDNYLDYTTVAPIIEYRVNNQSLYMAIDTGGTRSILLHPKIDSLISEEYLKSVEQFDYSGDKICEFCFEGDNFKYVVDPLGNFTTSQKYNYFDGFLGEDYLTQFKNVVFDYTQNKFYVDQNPICDKSLPMHKHDEWNLFFIDIEVNGEKTSGMIDTGSKIVFLSNVKNQNFRTNEFNYVDLRIGDINYENLEIGYGGEIITNKRAFEIMETYNIIGYPCFKDHVIQLDFEHNKFRIK